MAELISGQGLGSYYQSRTALPAKAPQAVDAEDAFYDLPAVQKDFVRAREDAELEASLLLEGITCSACLWLNERHLQALAGVTHAEVNYTTRRATVRWDPARLRLSQLLAAVRAIGYRALPATAQNAEALRQRERRASLWRMAVAGLGMMQVMMYALPAYVAQDAALSADQSQLLRWASLILTFPVMAFACTPFYRGAWRDLRNRSLGMDVPVALGLIIAFAASAYATVSGHGEVYFDSVSMFAFLLLLGRHVEQAAREKVARGLDLLTQALPLKARKLANYPFDEHETLMPATALVRGDVAVVRAGEAFPADGVIERGDTEADESLLTGESLPVRRGQGAAVMAGALNRLSPVLMRVERAAEQSRMAQIARLVQGAAAQRPRLARLADQVAAWFVLAVLLIALLTGLAWSLVDPAKALWTAVAVLVVSCPCALSLATPTVLAAATSALARRGFIVTRADAIEAMATATHFAFDKTGTLTRGQPRLIRIEPYGAEDASSVLRIAALLERHSEHPIARALVSAHGEGDLAAQVEDLRNLPGHGIEARLHGRRYRLGNAAFAGKTAPDTFSGGALTQVWLADEARVLARFDLSDTPRPGAAEMVRALERSGKSVLLMSGDALPVVRELAGALGIVEFQGGLDPEGKLKALRALQTRGARVVMVGDGINDAPVLAQADLSIAMGGGAALAQAHADAVLTATDLNALIDAHRIARRARQIMKQNLLWALAYNLCAIPLAASGWLTPWMAGVGMALSSLLVLFNAMRLMRTGSPTSALAVTPALAPA